MTPGSDGDSDRNKSLTTASHPQPSDIETPNRSCRVVALGASAGGLEAFQEFLGHVPGNSGFAYVLIQHLDPGHISALAEILQRSTDMPVLQVEDGERVVPDHVYIIPPNREMSIEKGRLRLMASDTPRGQRRPIDVFLTSLAADQKRDAVGIVLSGSGADGTSGLLAILAAGGLTLVQDPSTAKYDGMPTSAIQASAAKYVDSIEGIVKTLFNKDQSYTPKEENLSTGPKDAISSTSLDRLLLLLKNAVGHDFSLYKRPTLLRRIERRMAVQEIGDVDHYIRYITENKSETQSLFKELLINVTSFFRDPDAFDILKEEVLSKLVDEKPNTYVIRIWVAGCATGEEAYSIAILLHEVMAQAKRGLKVQLYATDLDSDAIATARTGLYPYDIAANVSKERLKRYFVKEDNGYRIVKEIREMIVFAVQSVVKDPPFTQLDLLSCRNLLIYFEPDLQSRLIPVFHYALRSGGALLLSPSETPGSNPDLFTAISRKYKLYRSVHTNASTPSAINGVIPWRYDATGQRSEEPVTKVKDPNFGELARRLLLQAYAPPSVVTDMSGNIRFVHGETGSYLRPAPGEASLNVIDMATESLQLELKNALNTAANGGAVISREVLAKLGDKIVTMRLSVRPMSKPLGSHSLFLISFQEGDRLRGGPTRRRKQIDDSDDSRRIKELEQELVYLREVLQANITEHQASNEQFKSTNEELQSTNEELQSTNEELETSKEELQSVNEELTTVNNELQSKIEQLGIVQNDMKNLLDNINVGTVFLDRKLTIRRFTREATRIYRLVSTDVGRPLTDIKSNLLDDELVAHCQSVIDSLVPFEKEVRTTDGISFQARIQPYQTIDNFIEGVVLTFSDMSNRIAAEAAERSARQLAESIIDTVREPLIVLDTTGKIISASRAFYQRFDLNPENTVGLSLYEMANRRWNLPALREVIETILPRDLRFDGFIEYDAANPEHSKMALNARYVAPSDGQRPLILLAIEHLVQDETL